MHVQKNIKKATFMLVVRKEKFMRGRSYQ